MRFSNDALDTWIDDTIWRPGLEAWRSLRTMRSKPPGAADTNIDRADTFRAALEQAQQQLVAARSVGYESRPLNLFYGLSQAGRAVAASAKCLPDVHPAAFQPGKDSVAPWMLDQHGIEARDLNRVTKRGFPRAMLATKGKSHSSGSFVRLAGLLSPGCDIRDGVSIGQLWASLPEAVRTEPLTTTSPTVLTLVLEGAPAPDRGELVKGRLYRWGEPPRQFAAALKTNGWLSDRTAAAFLNQYPLLARSTDGAPLYRLGKRDHSRAGVSAGSRNSLGTISGVCWPLSDEALESADREETALQEMTTDYRGRRVVLPRYATGRPARDEEPLHPLLIWWAILFGLSMLCRYRPVVWSQLIDVNHSRYASAIEHLLDVGIDAVPDLVERTIRQVAS